MSNEDIERAFRQAMAENADMIHQIDTRPDSVDVGAIMSEMTSVIVSAATNPSHGSMKAAAAALRHLGVFAICAATAAEEAIGEATR